MRGFVKKVSHFLKFTYFFLFDWLIDLFIFNLDFF